MPEKKPRKPKSIYGHVVNILIVSKERKGEEILLELFEMIHEAKVRKVVNADREMIIKSLFNDKYGDYHFCHGKLATAIDLSDEDWLNLTSLDDETYDVPPHLRAKLRQANYVLVPRAHRVFIERVGTSSVTLNQVKIFLKGAIEDTLLEGEEVDIHIETSHEMIDVISEAQVIKTLDFEISKSNNDTNKDAADWFEKQMVEMKANKMSASIRPRDKEEGLNIDNTIIKGGLELAKSNGNAKARVIDKYGNTQTVSTKKYNRKFKIPMLAGDNRVINMFNKVMSTFRNDL